MSAQLALFAEPAPISPAPIVAHQVQHANVWSEVVTAAREQQGSRLVISRPFGGIWDRVTSPEDDNWPALWRFYCWVSPRSSCPATSIGGYTDRSAA